MKRSTILILDPLYEDYKKSGLDLEYKRVVSEFDKLIEKHGYKRYEISNYAREGFECRHNLVYWSMDEYLGFGLGASSFIMNRRFSNPRSFEEYYDSWYTKRTKEDGKVDLSIREKAYIQMSIDADKLMKYLEEHNGRIPFNDKASPELIMDTMAMSKNEFKRAVGNLLKAGRIEIKSDSIVLK